MTVTKKLAGLSLLLIVFFSCSVFAQGLSSHVDRTNIGIDETVSLRIIFEAFQMADEPDISGLKQNFDILSNQRSTQKSNVNGKITQSTEWHLLLFPKRTGQLLIPPFTLKGFTSDPITIKVTDSAPAAQGEKPDIYLETSVDKNDIYVQEQFIVTYKLFFNRNVKSLDGAGIDTPNVRIEELPRVDYQKNIGNQSYGVAEFRYALIPDASGEIKIPAKTWTIQTTDQASMNRFGFNGGRQKLHRVKTEAITVNVQPKPDAYPKDKAWLPAKNLTMTDSWSQSPEQFKVGEPITRTITLNAYGVNSEQLPPVFNSDTTGDFKFYPDKPRQESNSTSEGVSGTRIESIAIVPSHGGQLTLPAISLTWWNTETKAIEETTLPAIIVNVAATQTHEPEQSQAIGIQATKNSQETITKTSTPLTLILLLIASLIVNLVVIVLFIQNKRQSDQGLHPKTPKDKPASNALNQIALACKQQDPQQLRNAIANWALVKWPNKSAITLINIANESKNEQLKQELVNLDQSLYSQKASDIDYSLILEQLKAMDKKTQTHDKSVPLAPLYQA